MTQSAIYRILYSLVHFLFSIFEFLCLMFEEIRDRAVDFCHEFGRQNDVINVKNVPKHLTIILGKEEPSYTDLRNIVYWCLGNNIGYLSFYDWQGVLQKNEDKLIKEVNHMKLENDHIIWHTTSHSTYRNGYTGRKIHIKILSEEDGRLGLVNLTKKLASKDTNVDISVETIDAIIQKQYCFPDPDMGIYCGKSLNLFNYPPWQIRITEFFCVKSHHRLSYRTFHRLLCLYSKCEQRLGK